MEDFIHELIRENRKVRAANPYNISITNYNLAIFNDWDPSEHDPKYLGSLTTPKYETRELYKKFHPLCQKLIVAKLKAYSVLNNISYRNFLIKDQFDLSQGMTYTQDYEVDWVEETLKRKAG